MAKFVVTNWTDQVKQKPDSYVDQFKQYQMFDSEDEARAYIRDRAFRGVIKAEKELRRAVARKRKCERKFPIRLIP